jgi:hypothetical protein
MLPRQPSLLKRRLVSGAARHVGVEQRVNATASIAESLRSSADAAPIERQAHVQPAGGGDGEDVAQAAHRHQAVSLAPPGLEAVEGVHGHAVDGGGSGGRGALLGARRRDLQYVRTYAHSRGTHVEGDGRGGGAGEGH